jgi:hypothetical protein
MHTCNSLPMPMQTRCMHVCPMPMLMLINPSWHTHHAPVEHFTRKNILFQNLICPTLSYSPCHVSTLASCPLVSSAMHTFCTYSPPPCQICFPFGFFLVTFCFVKELLACDLFLWKVGWTHVHLS